MVKETVLSDTLTFFKYYDISSIVNSIFASFLQQHTIFAVQYSLNNTHEGMVHYIPSVVFHPARPLQTEGSSSIISF